MIIVNHENINLIDNLDKVSYFHLNVIKLLSKYSEKLKVMYTADIFNHQRMLSRFSSVDKLRDYKIDLVIISLADHPTHFVDDLVYDELEAAGIPYVILTSYPSPNINSLYCPIWSLIFPTGPNMLIPTENQTINSNRHYQFSSLNNKCKIERVFFAVESLKNSTIFNNSIITLNKLDTKWSSFNESMRHIDALRMNFEADSDSDSLQILNNKLLPTLPWTHPTIVMNDEVYLSCNNEAFTNTFVNIVIEYGSLTSFVSEKSLKPLVSGQLFINLGAVGTIQILKNLGFDTFDDIVDHTKYEHIDSFIRIRKAIHYLNEIKDFDWQDIYDSTRHRRLYNRQLLLSGDIQNKFSQQLYNKIHEILR